MSLVGVRDIIGTTRENSSIYGEIVTERTNKISLLTKPAAVLGSVSCGMPQLEEEYIEEYVSLPVSLFGEGEFFILRASGDSMIGAGINSGDMIVIRKQNTAWLTVYIILKKMRKEWQLCVKLWKI